MLIGAALFEQERKRTGGLIDLEFRPTDDLRLDLQYFMSDLEATNYNRNYLLWGSRILGAGAGQAPDPGYVVRNNTLVAANFSAPVHAGTFVRCLRPDLAPGRKGHVRTTAVSRPAYQVSDALEISGQIGTSEGHGETPRQDVSETHPAAGSGASCQLNGIGSAPNFNFGTADTSTPVPNGTPVVFGWIFGAQLVDVEDEENWAQVDADYAVDRGAWTGLQFGVRYNEHSRESLNNRRPGPARPGHGPGELSDGLPELSGRLQHLRWVVPDEHLVLVGVAAGAIQRCAGIREPRPGVARRRLALLLGGGRECGGLRAGGFPGFELERKHRPALREDRRERGHLRPAHRRTRTPITGSLFGAYIGIPVDNTYNDWLPSANLKWQVSDDLVARFAASRTMTRADYSALGGATNLLPPATVGGTGTGSGGNPDLEPIRSWNYDAGIEWYFAENSLLAATVFYMDLENYVTFGSETKTYFTFSEAFPNGADVPYLLTVPVNAEGRVQGIELSYQQAITDNFGIAANYTYADGEQTSLLPASGDDRLVGTSEDTYNLSAYYETARFNARVTYTFRSEFFSGLDRNTRLLAGRHGLTGRLARVYLQRQLLGDPGRAEPQRPDAQVLRAQQGPAARVLQERCAVLPEPPLQVLIVCG